MNSKKKKNWNYIKEISYYYQYHIEIKIVSGENIIEYLKNRFKLIYTFNSSIKKSIKYGLNKANKYINKRKKEKIIIFIFFNELFSIYYDLMIIKNKDNKNIKLYFIDEKYNKEFLDVFNIKSCMAFTIIKNQSNEKVFDEIESKISQYAMSDNFREINLKK